MNRLLKNKNGVRYFRNGLYIFRHLPSDGDIDERINRLNNCFNETAEISKFTFWFIYIIYIIFAFLLAIPVSIVSILHSLFEIIYFALTALLEKMINLLDI